jgi:hypothetical protein
MDIICNTYSKQDKHEQEKKYFQKKNEKILSQICLSIQIWDFGLPYATLLVTAVGSVPPDQLFDTKSGAGTKINGNSLYRGQEKIFQKKYFPTTLNIWGIITI